MKKREVFEAKKAVEKRTSFCWRPPSELFKAIKEISKRNDVSVNSIITAAMRLALDEYNLEVQPTRGGKSPKTS